MSIWELIGNNPDDSYLGLESENARNALCAGVPLSDGWTPEYYRIVGRVGHFDVSGGIFIKDTALSLLLPYIQPEVEVLPIYVEDAAYSLLNVTNVIDCLDRELSDIQYFKSGRVMIVDRYVLKTDLLRTAMLFKIPEFSKTRVYCTDAFRSLVIENGFTGLGFIELS